VTRIRDAAVLFLVVFSLAARVSAQTQEQADPSEAARFRFGPLRFTPSIAFTNLGVDTNVFNDPDHPVQDTVGTAGPASDYWMRVGPSLITGKTSLQYMYFEKYATQRAWNSDNRLRWELPFTRLIPFVEGSYANQKNRTSYEIDSRARQITQDVGIGTDLFVSSKTRIRMLGSRARFKYDDNETYLGVNLGQELDRWTNTERLQLFYKLTSQTTFAVKSEAAQDRFADRLRNTNSIAVVPGFEMKPTALVSGSVFVGFRNFTPLEPEIPSYRGPVASVDARYIAGATRLGLTVKRDLAFSYQATQPYYTLTDVGIDVLQRITYTWDVMARTSRQMLDYTVRQVPGSALPPQVDRIVQFGGGIGYRLGQTFRLGINADYFQRRSTNALLRDFEGFRAGASITYGLQQ